MTIAYLALGSNLGDRLAMLRAAVRALVERPSLSIELPRDVASLYETSPVGGPVDQPTFFNSALRVQTSLAPADLLAAALFIETSHGRTRQNRWEPRVIDIDLLFVGDTVIDSPGLILPHPRWHERRFVLEPLSELAADLIDPRTGMYVGRMAESLRNNCGTEAVMRIAGPEWVFGSTQVSPAKTS